MTFEVSGLAHAAVCVPDVDAAVDWYRSVLGLRILSSPYRMEGDAIERDMGELVPTPVVLKAAIVGTGADDHVLELIEYPAAQGGDGGRGERGRSITDPGISHIGLLCEDLDQARRDLEGRGVKFLTSSVAEVAGLRTTWFEDPWGVVFILMQKGHGDRPYWRQWKG